MADDKKKIAAMLVMGLKNKKASAPADKTMPGSESEDMAEGQSDEPDMSDHEAAAQEVMDALNSGDTAGFAEALKSFVKMCDYDAEEASEGE